MFHSHRKTEKGFFWQLEMFDVSTTGDTAHTGQHVWQELEYHIDVCRVARGAHVKHL